MSGICVDGVTFFKVKNDSNGNPQYKIQFTELLSIPERAQCSRSLALERAEELGYEPICEGYEFILQSYSLKEDAKYINNLKNRANERASFI